MAKGLRNLPITFEDPHLTHFAGMALIQAFCQKLRLKRLLQRCLRPVQQSRDYQPAELLSALLYAVTVMAWPSSANSSRWRFRDSVSGATMASLGAGLRVDPIAHV